MVSYLGEGRVGKFKGFFLLGQQYLKILKLNLERGDGQVDIYICQLPYYYSVVCEMMQAINRPLQLVTWNFNPYHGGGGGGWESR